MPRVPGVACLPVFCLALALSCAAASATREASDSETAFYAEVKQRVYASVAPEDERGFTRKGPPRDGEWLALHKESPQTLESYRFAVGVRPSPQRRTLVIQPLGEFTAEQTKFIETMREYMEIFFQLPARVAPVLPLTVNDSAVELTRRVGLGHRRGGYSIQYNADRILEHILLKKLPDDAVVYLGITMADLWSDDLNYVFGLGSLNQRVGVYSLCRYFPEFWGQPRNAGSDTLALSRSCKVLNHETGHLFGLTHCVFYACTMNGSNSLVESDAAPLHLCPVCHRKLQWNVGFDAAARYEALRKFYEKYGLAAEAAWTAERLKNWKIVAAREARRPESEE